jgi:CheY-like chemotaxis protein
MNALPISAYFFRFFAAGAPRCRGAAVGITAPRRARPVPITGFAARARHEPPRLAKRWSSGDQPSVRAARRQRSSFGPASGKGFASPDTFGYPLRESHISWFVLPGRPCGFAGMSPDEAGRLTPTSAIANFILVVEDDEDEAGFLKEFLERHRYRVTIAKDGGQAHATFVMRKPDFVILDLILPGESGFEVCQRMKQANSTIPVLILTAIDMADSRALADRVGADGYLTKPFDPEELLRSIEQVALRNWEKTHGDQGKEEKRIRFACRCGKRFKVSAVHRGKTLSCPECGELVTVPHRV